MKEYRFDSKLRNYVYVRNIRNTMAANHSTRVFASYGFLFEYLTMYADYPADFYMYAYKFIANLYQRFWNDFLHANGKGFRHLTSHSVLSLQRTRSAKVDVTERPSMQDWLNYPAML